MRRLLPRTTGLAWCFGPVLAVAAFVGLSQLACISTAPSWRQIRLYDMRNGDLLIAYVDSNPYGTRGVQVTMADGEVCEGQYSIVQEGFVTWGQVFGTVWGRNYSAQTTSTTASTYARGYAVARGPSGTVAECAFLTDGRQGYGACTDNRGRTYKVLF